MIGVPTNDGTTASRDALRSYRDQQLLQLTAKVPSEMLITAATFLLADVRGILSTLPAGMHAGIKLLDGSPAAAPHSLVNAVGVLITGLDDSDAPNHGQSAVGHNHSCRCPFVRRTGT